MPPRYAYWTILIDQKPTAFRAREREELLPTFHQLRRKNTDVVMKWFARGRLWESPEAAQAAQRAPKPPLEKRGRDWRPGGEHRDPRDRFKKRSSSQGARSESWGDREKPGGRPPSRPWSNKPASGPPRSSQPWSGKPKGGAPRGERPSTGTPKGRPPRGDRPWSGKPPGAQRREHAGGQACLARTTRTKRTGNPVAHTVARTDRDQAQAPRARPIGMCGGVGDHWAAC